MSAAQQQRYSDWFKFAMNGYIDRTSDQHFFVTPDEPHPIKAYSVCPVVQGLYQLVVLRLQNPAFTGGALFTDNGSKEVWHR